MQSMTGFGSARNETDGQVITVQIASVNNRQCRVSVRGDLRDLALEEQVRSRTQERLQRGSITVQIGIQTTAALGQDLSSIRAAWRELAAAAAEDDAPVPSYDLAARLVSRSDDQNTVAAEVVLAVVDEALAACVAMRATEGANLHAVMVGLADELTSLRTQMGERAAGRVERWRERLLERLNEVLRDRAEITPEHLIRELAVYTDRIDVSEELDRLDSHLAQLRELLARKDAVGKQVEFLLQEFGREINTTGSKANDADLQRVVVDAKSVLERLREQAANIL